MTWLDTYFVKKICKPMVIDHQMKEEGHDQNYYWFLTFNVYPFVFYLSFWLSRYYDLWIACLEHLSASHFLSSHLYYIRGAYGDFCAIFKNHFNVWNGWTIFLNNIFFSVSEFYKKFCNTWVTYDKQFFFLSFLRKFGRNNKNCLDKSNYLNSVVIYGGWDGS